MKKILFALLLFLPLSGNTGDLKQVIEKFDAYAENQRKAWDVTGMAVGIVKGDEIIFLKGYGQRGLQNREPVDANTLFQIGSLSKAFTSALTAIAVDEGLLKWEDKVIDHFPSFRMADPWVTAEFEIADLFAQRSGLPPFAGDTQSFLGYNRKEILNHLRFLKPISSFRSSYAYQNVFFLVAAHILETKYRLSYEALLEKKLFLPLEMTHSNATLEDDLKTSNRAEWLMRQPDGKTVQVKENLPYANWNYVLGPAGGINSTAQDMAKWIMFQANRGRFKHKELISRENMERMARPMIYAGKTGDHSIYYALGWLYMPYSPYSIIWHNGATLGVSNAAAFIPEEKLGIVVLSNVRETQLALALVFQFFDMYFDKPDQNWSQRMLDNSKKETQKIQQQEEKKSLSPSAFSRYTGTYQNPVYGEALVKEEDDHLTLIIGKNQQHLELIAWQQDLFKLKWPLVLVGSTDESTTVQFLPNIEGKMKTMQIELFSKEGNGDFQKVKNGQ